MRAAERGAKEHPLAPESSPMLAANDIATEIAQRGLPALKMLLDAHLYAANVGRDVWDFALEIRLLSKNGLNHSDLRWMICRGLLESAVEVRTKDGQSRSFRPASQLQLPRKSCCILNASGVVFVQGLLGSASRAVPNEAREDYRAAVLPMPATSPRAMGGAPGRNQALMRPKWDPDRQELRVGEHVVKQFKVPAPNQETILAAFDEDDWPVRIDDPLPPRSELDPKRRLHDTIVSLNRKQKVKLLRFLGDGSGQGVRWEFTSPRR